MEDRLFREPVEKKFEFDERVAAVFDDMIERSVPFYRQNLELITEIVCRKLPRGGRLLDLGCSTGGLLIEIANRCGVSARLVGIDSASAMVARARKKAQAYGAGVDFVCADLMEHDLGQADIVVANYTLQFIRPVRRPKAVRRIYEALKEGGLFIFSEKILMHDKWLDKQMIDIYYDYKKRRGYSETEIARKREALENVLVPYTVSENISMVKEAGFSTVDTVFQWGNFATFAAHKKGE
ncbi:carboxy-S-adenosyl-L-methionine synthase CmoA [Hydrogenimonas sp. SS33]|uniref:carboxy-S-adenosyl-L-methionine synthase CmoA n=1 Tax=Hydrogenimonas leucolamina TaxID=2954236 RepID=UPI00336BEC33